MKTTVTILAFVLCSWICFTQCGTQSVSESIQFTGQYPDVSGPDGSAKIFSPGHISTSNNVRDIAISPDGDQIYFTLAFPKYVFSSILFTEKVNGKWSEIKVAPFSGKYTDIEPAFSPDGKKLFFASKRPKQAEGKVGDYDIWFVEKQNTAWSEPINAGESVNDSGNEFYPSIGRSGNLYFTAAFPDSRGGEDIYMCKFENGTYSPAINLGDSINTVGPEFNAFVSPDEDYLIYSSFGRKDGLGGGDLYVSWRLNDSTWTKSINPGEPINSVKMDYCPYVSLDKKVFFFTSERTDAFYEPAERTTDDILNLINSNKNGNGNIYWVDAEILFAKKTF